MLFRFQFSLIVLSFLLLGIMAYEIKFKNSATAWENYKQPQLAEYSSLDQEAEILQELERQQRFETYKALDPSAFTKSNIFNPIKP